MRLGVVGREAEVDGLGAGLRRPGRAASAGSSRGSGRAAAAPAPSTSSSPVDSTPTRGRRHDRRPSSTPEGGEHAEVAGR